MLHVSHVDNVPDQGFSIKIFRKELHLNFLAIYVCLYCVHQIKKWLPPIQSVYPLYIQLQGFQEVLDIFGLQLPKTPC